MTRCVANGGQLLLLECSLVFYSKDDRAPEHSGS